MEQTNQFHESLWTVTIRFQAGLRVEADTRCNRYNRSLRGNDNDWGYNHKPGRRAPAGDMYEAWFIVPASKLQSFEEMMRLDIIRDASTYGLYDYRVSLSVSW